MAFATCALILLQTIFSAQALADYEGADRAYRFGDVQKWRTEVLSILQDRRDEEALDWLRRLYGGGQFGGILHLKEEDRKLVVGCVTPAVERSSDAEAMFRLSRLWGVVGADTQQVEWMRRAARLRYVERDRREFPRHAKYEYAEMLLARGLPDQAVTLMEESFLEGDLDAERWLIAALSGRELMANSSYGRAHSNIASVKPDLDRAATLLRNRAMRDLDNPAATAQMKADALIAFGYLELGRPNVPANPNNAIKHFLRAWELANLPQAAGGVARALWQGAGSYAPDERKALIDQWTFKASFPATRAVH